MTGQGFGQAAEDAHELASQLRLHGLTEKALRAFEDARIERCKRVADSEWVSCSSVFSSPEPWRI